MLWRIEDKARQAHQAPEADICLIAEGCYPYVAGGVSTWIDWLIRSHPDLSFSVLAILPGEPDSAPRYEQPPNLRAIHHLRLDDKSVGTGKKWPDISPHNMSDLLGRLLNDGNTADFNELIGVLGRSRHYPSLDALLNSQEAWQTMCRGYEDMPHASFLGYFWAWRTLVGGLFHVLTCPLPKARLYHAVSTGYAGLIGARAAIETGRASLITEHGIYSNERRIEILMADWIANSIETGLDLTDDRKDIRELWARAFESFARIAYTVAREIVALYEANQVFQYALGARPEQLRIIPNGVDIGRFAAIERHAPERPTIAFIGRVTPIKDVQTFIDVADQLRIIFPDLEALLIGPMDEDPDYAQGCRAEVLRRGLYNTVTFTGPVDVRQYLGRIDVLVLTSISEALPLVLLEAGAAGVPCVATDVGACREILEGRQNNGDNFGPGGIVAPVGAGDDIADAIATLLSDPDKCRTYGANLRHRVETHYRADAIAAAYGAFYARNLNPQLLGAD